MTTLHTQTKTVIIRNELGQNSPYGYNARETYEVIELNALYYEVVEPKEKAGFHIIRDHCKEVTISDSK